MTTKEKRPSPTESRKEDFPRYIELLTNECSFDSLFCETVKVEEATLFYNSKFPGDPVFNHVKLNPALMSKKGAKILEFEEVLQKVNEASRDLSLKSTTIFIEDFWTNTILFQSAAIEYGFRVFEKMNILSKQLGHSKTSRSGEKEVRTLQGSKEGNVKVLETKDVGAWNDIFMGSYLIPEDWRTELLNRERLFLQNGNPTILLLAVEGEGIEVSEASGCVLLHEYPKGIMGVYCVGTLPQKRGRGIARSMLEGSEVIAQSSGCKIMTLQTIASDNVTPMYVRLGYALEFERNVLQATLF